MVYVRYFTKFVVSFFLVCVSNFSFLPVVAAQIITLGDILIEKDFYGFRDDEGSDFFSFNTFSPDVLISLEQIPEYSVSVDVKSRVSFGLSQDVSIRGSSFEESRIDLNGIPCNDPQTGHYSAELPLTAADLASVSIDANAHSIRYQRRKPEGQGGFLSLGFGEHALWEEMFSINFPVNKVRNRFSFEHASSSGATQDTDFDKLTASFNALWQSDSAKVDFFAGMTDRDFGAGSAYSSSYPHQEEHIRQQFVSVQTALDNERFRFENAVFMRRHADHFILDRHRPTMYSNDHTTYVYGTDNILWLRQDFFVKFFAKREKITSTNLANHDRVNKGFGFKFNDYVLDSFRIDVAGNINYYERWRWLHDARVGLRYLFNDVLFLHMSLDRLWRVPSFTELYYVSPANTGNQNLLPSTSYNYEVGVSYRNSTRLSCDATFFVRDQAQTIDWVRNSALDPWQALNVKELTAYGVEVESKVFLNHNYAKEISLGYRYMTLNRENPFVFSKYAFDYSRHRIVSSVQCDVSGFDVNVNGIFSKPISRKSYTTVDLKIAKAYTTFDVVVEAVNIFDKQYQEITDISGMGRWVKVSLVYRF